MFMDENEKKYFSHITNYIIRLMDSLHSYLNFFSQESEKKEYSFNFNKNKSLISIESIDNESEEQIKKKTQNFFIEFQKVMSFLNAQLEEFGKYYEKNISYNHNNRNIDELITLYHNYEKMTMKNILFKEKMQKNELVFLIFKQIVNICQFSIVGETIKSEIKNSYIIRKKNNKQEKNGTSNIQAYIKTKIDNYIKNYLKNGIEFNYDHKGFISIKYLPLLIIIGLPIKDNIMSLKHKITININFINGKKEHQYFILIEKLKILIDNRISSMLSLIFDEKKITNQKIVTFSENTLVDFIINLLNYLYNFNNIFITKCALCNHISKYSYIEKCFFPPYYKLFKLNKFGINENENLFFHEDCFKRMSNPSL